MSRAALVAIRRVLKTLADTEPDPIRRRALLTGAAELERELNEPVAKLKRRERPAKRGTIAAE